MSKVSEEQAADILRKAMERTSPIRQKLDAHCRAIDERIERATNPHERIERLQTALEKCIDTFDDLQRVLRLLGKPMLADACAVAFYVLNLQKYV